MHARFRKRFDVKLASQPSKPGKHLPKSQNLADGTLQTRQRSPAEMSRTIIAAIAILFLEHDLSVDKGGQQGLPPAVLYARLLSSPDPAAAAQRHC